MDVPAENNKKQTFAWVLGVEKIPQWTKNAIFGGTEIMPLCIHYTTLHFKFLFLTRKTGKV